MKKMRKLLPAFAMLLVSAIMLSTASFAWFTTTAAVTATGMQVKAQADGGLVIAGQKVNDDASRRDPNANEYASSVNVADSTMKWWTNGADEIKPVSMKDGYWFTATGTTQSNGAASGTYSAVLESTGSTHYLATKYYFKALAEGTTNYLKVTDVTVTATDANRSLDKAIRVALCVDGTWFVFAPKQTGNKTDFYYVSSTAGVSPTKTAYIDADNFYVGDITEVTISDDLTSTTPVVVDVYIYYEGEDPNCMSANAVDIQTLAIELAFSAKDVTAP